MATYATTFSPIRSNKLKCTTFYTSKTTINEKSAYTDFLAVFEGQETNVENFIDAFEGEKEYKSDSTNRIMKVECQRIPGPGIRILPQ